MTKKTIREKRAEEGTAKTLFDHIRLKNKGGRAEEIRPKKTIREQQTKSIPGQGGGENLQKPFAFLFRG